MWSLFHWHGISLAKMTIPVLFKIETNGIVLGMEWLLDNYLLTKEMKERLD